MASKVLVTDHVFADLETEREILSSVDCELVHAPGTGERELIEGARDCDAMLVCYAKISNKVVSAASEGPCRVISRYGIGYDNIDVEAATRHGILVTYVPDYCLDEVADHTFALLLALVRDLVRVRQSVAGGEWRVPHGAVRRLRGRRLAVIGVGGIGRRVVARAEPFGLSIVGFDPHVEQWDVNAERATSFEAAVERAELVTLHAPLTPENQHLINPESIAAMQCAPIVVNTARGGLVDMDAAAEALTTGTLGGIALDVTELEPPPTDHPLRTHPRAVLTPHMAFYSVEAQEELQRRAAEEVARALRGEPPDQPVNPEVLEGAPRS